jgi:hypothetical protein
VRQEAQSASLINRKFSTPTNQHTSFVFGGRYILKRIAGWTGVHIRRWR